MASSAHSILPAASAHGVAGNGEDAEAWTGLLEAHKRLTRELDAELGARFGLTLSALELLACLDAAPGRCLRLSALAEETGLSLSRVSRIVAALAGRGLIVRTPCPDDARAVEASLSRAGRTLMREAHRVHRASVQRLFFDRLSAAEVATLTAVFRRLAPRMATQR